MREEQLPKFNNYLHNTLVILKDEFFKHATYLQIQLANSYEYWNISKDIEYVIVAQPDWITSLAASDKEALLRIQISVGRGLIFPLDLFSAIDVVPVEYILEEKEKQYVVLQYDMWNKLPFSSKEETIKAYALLWDNWLCSAVPMNIPAHLKSFANTFSEKAGANCLAATLFAVSSQPEYQEWIIHEWVHQKTFLAGLKNASYKQTEEELHEADVVAWVNEEGVIQHAAYHIGNQLFFNKNGQTFFNPWKVIHLNELNEEWKKFSVRIYRKFA